jgi:hypothetical protein
MFLRLFVFTAGLPFLVPIALWAWARVVFVKWQPGERARARLPLELFDRDRR